ncbi:MAG: hypothetical protein ACRDC6_14605, partial [Shewanella sp.]
RQPARFAGSLVSSNGSDGAPQTALWPTPSMASAKARFEHPCSRAKSGASSARGWGNRNKVYKNLSRGSCFYYETGSWKIL